MNPTRSQRRRWLRRAAACGSAHLARPAGWSLLAAAASARSQPADEAAQRAQTALVQRAAAEGMGLAAGWASPGRQTLVYAGRRSAADSSAPDERSAFEWGSVTKTVIGLLLADMSLKGELALDEPVEAALPHRLRDSVGAPITFEDLATHRSGLPRLPGNLQPRDPANPYADYGPSALRAFLEGWQPEVPRQARWLYSNLGFGLLGQALALRAGRPLAGLLTARVLKPMGLGSTGWAMTGSPAPALLPGHDAQGQPVPRWTFDALAGAGALWGTAPDLLRYASAAAGATETPLAAAFALARQARAETDRPQTRIGLAWLLGQFQARPLANHDGGTFGFASSVMLDPETRSASVVLSNAATAVTDMALHLLDARAPLRDAAAERQQRQQVAVPVTPAELARLAGVYALSPGFKLTVRPREGRLFAQATGQGEFELFAAGAGRFFARVAAIELTFDPPDGEKPPSAFTLRQSGATLRFTRE